MKREYDQTELQKLIIVYEQKQLSEATKTGRQLQCYF